MPQRDHRRPDTQGPPIRQPVCAISCNELDGCGCLDWQRSGLMPPSVVIQATDNYRADSDELGDFLAAKCGMDPSAQAPASAFYVAYKAWCETSGGDALSARRFGSMVAERAGVTKKRTNAGNVYVGVRLV